MLDKGKQSCTKFSIGWLLVPASRTAEMSEATSDIASSFSTGMTSGLATPSKFERLTAAE